MLAIASRDRSHMAALCRALAALANPSRVAILRQLDAPKSLNEIRVSASEPSESGLSRSRCISRQAVRRHLDRLVEEDLVRVAMRLRANAEVATYMTNDEKLRQIGDSLDDLILELS